MEKQLESGKLFQNHSTDEIAYNLALIYCKEHISEYPNAKILANSFIEEYSDILNALNKGDYERWD